MPSSMIFHTRSAHMPEPEIDNPFRFDPIKACEDPIANTIIMIFLCKQQQQQQQ